MRSLLFTTVILCAEASTATIAELEKNKHMISEPAMILCAIVSLYLCYVSYRACMKPYKVYAHPNVRSTR